MRKVIALLVAVLMVASTVRAGSLACMGPSPELASSHSCCPETATMTTPSPAACCAMSDGSAQRGPGEARVDVPVPQVVSIDARAPHRAMPPHRTHTRGAPHLAAAVPLYLQQLSLLI